MWKKDIISPPQMRRAVCASIPTSTKFCFTKQKKNIKFMLEP